MIMKTAIKVNNLFMIDLIFFSKSLIIKFLSRVT